MEQAPGVNPSRIERWVQSVQLVTIPSKGRTNLRAAYNHNARTTLIEQKIQKVVHRCQQHCHSSFNSKPIHMCHTSIAGHATKRSRHLLFFGINILYFVG